MDIVLTKLCPNILLNIVFFCDVTWDYFPLGLRAQVLGKVVIKHTKGHTVVQPYVVWSLVENFIKLQN